MLDGLSERASALRRFFRARRLERDRLSTPTTLRGMGEDRSEYSHDSLSDGDLDEILDPQEVPLGESPDHGPSHASLLEKRFQAEEPEAHPLVDELPTGGSTKPAGIATSVGGPEENPPQQLAFREEASKADSGALLDGPISAATEEVDHFGFNDGGLGDDSLEWQFDDLESDSNLDLALADFEDVPSLCVDDDLKDQVEHLELEITDDLRARQLARAFLAESDDLSRQHVEWLVDIILARQWSSAQLQVRSLLLRGASYEQIHLAFGISEAWRSAGSFDLCCEKTPEQPVVYPRGRISWAEAINIVEFLRAEKSVEEMIDFLESERMHWRERSELRRDYPRFSDYLFKYRLSRVDRRPDTMDQINLPPEDERTFDGGWNPEFSNAWWDDAIDYPCTEDLVQAHFERGRGLASLVGDL